MAKNALTWVAPKDGKAHQIFIAKAVEAGFSAAVVRDFFYQINAHPELISFVQISRNLIDILQLPCDEWQDNEAGIDFRAWQSLCRWATENAHALTDAIGPSFDERPKRHRHNPLLRKGVTRHPLYSALWNVQENPRLRSHYAALQAQVLYAHALAIQEAHTAEAYESYDGDNPLLDSPRSASAMGYTVRALSYAVAEDELLVLQPFVSPKTFGREVGACLWSMDLAGQSGEVLLVDKAKEKRQNGLRDLVYFVERAHGKRSWAFRESHGPKEGSGGGKSEPGHVDFQTMASGLEVNLGTGVSDRFVPALPPKGSIAGRLKVDESPFDDGEGSYFFSDEEESGTSGGAKVSNPAASFLRARNQARHIAMANQYLPWRYESLTDQEIHNVAMAALSYLNRPVLISGSKEEKVFHELALLTLIVLWTGVSWERAIGLRIQRGRFKRRKRYEEPEEQYLRLSLSPVRNLWCIESTFPEYKTELKVPEESGRKILDNVLLPDLCGLTDRVLDLLKRRGQKPSPKTKVFTHSAKLYRKAFKKLVHDAGESERVTWGRWEKVMFDAITAETGDVVDAVAITGEPHVLAQTKCFYFSPNVGDLIDRYVAVAAQLAKQAELPLDSDEGGHLIGAEQRKVYVGSRACASKPAVVNAVSDLKARLGAARTYDLWSDFAEYHNVFTFYTVQMLAFATGYRAVKTPLFSLEEINGQLRLTALSDKDNEQKRKTRLSYLPNMVLRQLEHYEQHLKVLEATNDFRFKSSFETEKETCFFLRSADGRDGKLLVGPKTMVRHLDEFLGLPANAHRRFMRTELREADCPPDYVNAFMGHASFGEEPWSRYSSLSSRQYRDMMTRYLEPIMEELGFTPVASRLAGGVSR
ncbi:MULTISPECIES: hypothetical protein [unclassified Marinobacter]|uniref:hypothetical protein n=1 Tax=unclassified Marinobacter TaxID=83889 RepID=UPI00192749CC|nr:MULTISPECIES: hypothetical protein [unclassified Marinobacter]MBL3827227.1 hypothetical protein [Marinobacter sp. MC3]MBL3895683.1 hypothetical protein [Marinobacter sp. MW3]